jgi:acyl-CoA reductase-like NAD-dependent aldehyde dehydrogenase
MYSWRISAASSALEATVAERAVTDATELGNTPCPEARTESACMCLDCKRFSASCLFTLRGPSRPPPLRYASTKSNGTVVGSKASPQPTMIAVWLSAWLMSIGKLSILVPSGRKSSAAYRIFLSRCISCWIFGSTSPRVSHSAGRWIIVAPPELAKPFR